ncbi:hypothetical protein [Metallibacterium sp.]|uniref:M61 family metallopeptidase n=1 Tax=Metallibacterium sp. TaxID=2940281 RepID=UPI00263272AC|nr:hypothetical protein [Metallibacterium sp.]
MNHLSLQKILVAVLLGASLPLAVHARTQTPADVGAEYAGPVQPYPGLAQSSGPGGTPMLHVDLTDAPRRIFRVRETIPVWPGALTLYCPKWIPGEHSPSVRWPTWSAWKSPVTASVIA